MSKESNKDDDLTFGSYAQLGSHRTVCVRGSIYESFPTCGWPPEKARKLAAYIVKLADESEMGDPDVVRLAEDLAEIDLTEFAESWSTVALALKRKGYHR